MEHVQDNVQDKVENVEKAQYLPVYKLLQTAGIPEVNFMHYMPFVNYDRIPCIN